MSGIFVETPRFPDDLAIWSKSGISSSTQVAQVKSGREQRNSIWVYPKAKFDISNSLRLPDLSNLNVSGATTAYRINLLRDWIVAMQGQLVGFRFKDWTDYMDEGRGTFTALPNSTTTVFQMAKSYTIGSQTVLRLIAKPLATGIAVFVNGGAASYTYDPTTGLVTFSTAPSTGQVITWTGQFDTPVRFGADVLEYGLIADGLYEVQSIPLMEIRI
jgi:uncharacterized protein (TIGR02217 family)